VPSSSKTSAMMTCAPFSANNFAVAAPIPLAPPVITATLPSSLNKDIERKKIKLLNLITWNLVTLVEISYHMIGKMRALFLNCGCSR
jgi:hypothetical protein